MIRVTLWGLLMVMVFGITGCKRQSVKEDFSRFPYQITKTPYRAYNVYGWSMAWVDNETVLFTTWLKEQGKWRNVLGEWKTSGTFRIVADKSNSLCSRDGYTLYYVGKLGFSKGKRRLGKVFYGRYGKDMKLYPEGTRFHTINCVINRQRKSLKAEDGQYHKELIIPGTFISSNNYSMNDIPPSSYFLDKDGNKTLLPFSADDARYYQYFDHLDRYYINRVTPWVCSEGQCYDSQQFHIWSFDERGKVEQINLNKKYPWFGFSLDMRHQGHMYRLYPTAQGDLLAINGDPSWRIKKGGGVYLMKEGHDPIQLIDGSIDPPAFSPDGCKIAIARDTYPLARSWKNRTDRLVIIDLCKPTKSG